MSAGAGQSHEGHQLFLPGTARTCDLERGEYPSYPTGSSTSPSRQNASDNDEMPVSPTATPWRGASGLRDLPPLDTANISKLDKEEQAWSSFQSESSWNNTATNTAVDKSRWNSVDSNAKIDFGLPPMPTIAQTGPNSESILSADNFVKEKLDLPNILPPPVSTLAPSLSLLHQVALVFVCCLAQFLNLGGMNQTVAPVMILSDYFDIRDYGTLSWFSAAYSMSVGTFILPAGRLGDMYGHKRIFLVGWVWFAVWSLITGFSYVSSSIVLFSVCRAFQGIGPALLVPNAIALLARNFAVGQPRNIAFAAFGAAGPTGATAGAVFTALIAQLGWWPWCFWILAITCVLVTVLVIFVVPGPVLGGVTSKSKVTFDYWGCILGVSGLILVNFALNQAPLDGWSMWYIPSTLILGIAFLWTFIMVELNFTTDPLIPIRGLGKDAYFALGCIACGWASHGIWAYYLYLYLQQVQGHSALLTAAMTSPVAITGIFFALFSVYLVRRLGVAYTMLFAMVNFLIGSLLLATVPLHQTYWLQIFLSIIIMPGAMNLSFPSATILLSNALPPEKQGIAASLVSTMVNYCISCGLGLAGSIHRSFYENAFQKHGPPGHGPGPNHGPPLSVVNHQMSKVRIDSFRGPWAFMCALSALGVAVAGVYVLRTQTKTLKGDGSMPSLMKRKVSPRFGSA